MSNGTSFQRGQEAMTASSLAFLAVLLMAGAILYAWRLPEGSLETWDESLTAQRALEMAERKEWLIPSFDGEPSFHKPPLYYAITALVYHVWGVHEGSVRLLSVVLGWGCLAALFILSRRVSGSIPAGFWALGFLLLNPHWMNWTRQGLLDTGVALALLVPLILLHPSRPSPLAWLGAGLALALGTMIKNPLPVLGLFIVLMDRRWVRNIPLPWPCLGRTLLVWLVAGLFWYVWCMGHPDHGELFRKVFFGYNIQRRFTTALPGHEMPFYFYFAAWWRHAPIQLILFALSLFLLAPRPGRRPGPGWPFAVWCLILLAVLSCLPSKRDTYLLLVYPMASIAMADVVGRMGKDRLARGLKLVAALLLGGGLILFFKPAFQPVIQGQPWNKDAALAIRANAQPGDRVLLFDRYGGAFQFYSRQPCASIPRGEATSWLPAAWSNATGRLYVVYPEWEPHKAGPGIHSWLNSKASVWHSNPAFRVYRLEPGGRTIPPENASP